MLDQIHCFLKPETFQIIIISHGIKTGDPNSKPVLDPTE